jgi:hypothetical protein
MAENNSVASQKPGIYIIRDTVAPIDLTIPSNIVTLKINGEPTGEHESQALSGAHLIRIESKKGAEAEAIAEELYNRFLIFGPAIQDDLRLWYFGVKEMTRTQKAENGNFVAGLTVVWNGLFFWDLPEMVAW